MTKISVLQKRLQELESELTLEFSNIRPQASFDHHHHQRYAQYFEKRFDFLRKLLSAEVASRPKKPYHLLNIVRWFTELETKFKEWENTKALTLDQFEPVSTCSCADSCFNDDRDASPEPGFEVAGKFYEGLVEEKVHDMEESWLNDNESAATELGSPGFEEAKKFFEELRDEKVHTLMEEFGDGAERNMNREENRLWVVKYVGAMSAGLVLGMALMGLVMVKFSGCFHYVKCSSFLTPT